MFSWRDQILTVNSSSVLRVNSQKYFALWNPNLRSKIQFCWHKHLLKPLTSEHHITATSEVNNRKKVVKHQKDQCQTIHCSDHCSEKTSQELQRHSGIIRLTLTESGMHLHHRLLMSLNKAFHVSTVVLAMTVDCRTKCGLFKAKWTSCCYQQYGCSFKKIEESKEIKERDVFVSVLAVDEQPEARYSTFINYRS